MYGLRICLCLSPQFLLETKWSLDCNGRFLFNEKISLVQKK
jgi:hypothetical protein